MEKWYHNSEDEGCWSKGPDGYQEVSVNCRQLIIDIIMHSLLKCFIFTVHNCVMLNYIE